MNLAAHHTQPLAQKKVNNHWTDEGSGKIEEVQQNITMLQKVHHAASSQSSAAADFYLSVILM